VLTTSFVSQATCKWVVLGFRVWRSPHEWICGLEADFCDW